MKNENIIVNKSYKFAIRIVKMYQHLTSEKKEFILSKQILRSGTSIGANIEEAEGSISRKEFIAKIQIAYKEAKETRYWIKLLNDTDYIDQNIFQSIIADCDELLKIIVSILKSTKSNRTKF